MSHDLPRRFRRRRATRSLCTRFESVRDQIEAKSWVAAVLLAAVPSCAPAPAPTPVDAVEARPPAPVALPVSAPSYPASVEPAPVPTPSEPPLRAANCPASAAAVAAYRSCISKRDDFSCRKVGGSWKPYAGMSGGGFECVCPLPDDGCPCRTAATCADSCVVPEESPCTPPFHAICGRFWERHTCVLDESGKRSEIFVDR